MSLLGERWMRGRGFKSYSVDGNHDHWKYYLSHVLSMLSVLNNTLRQDFKR